MTHLSPIMIRRTQQRTVPLSNRPGIIIPPPIDAARRLPPIRLPPLIQQPEINSHNPFAPTASPTSGSKLPPLMPKQYPKTPTFQMREPLSVIVQRCLAHPRFRVVEQPQQIDIFHWRKETSNGELANDLNTILRVVRSKGLRMTLTNGDFVQLLRMLCRYVFKQKPRLPFRNPFGESTPSFEITDYCYLEIAHAILQALVAEPMLVQSFIDKKFVSHLMDELDTPVLQEQQNVENEVHQIVEGFPHLRMFAIRSMMSRLADYRSGHRSSYCVAPVLRIMQAFFEKSEESVMDKDDVYRRYIVPLYYTDYLCDFEKPIRAVTTYFCKRNGENAEACLRGLLEHWPVTAPRKEVSFIQQLSLLMQHSRESSLPSICPKVLNVMARCIESEHAGVALSACFLMMDGQFLCSFASVRELFVVLLVPALRKARLHWKGDLKSMATQLLETLGDECPNQPDQDKKDKEAKEMWQKLAKKTALPLSMCVIL